MCNGSLPEAEIHYKMFTSDGIKELRNCKLAGFITKPIHFIVQLLLTMFSLTRSIAAIRSGGYVNVTVNIICRLLQYM